MEFGIGVIIGAFAYMFINDHFWERMYENEQRQHYRWFDKYIELANRCATPRKDKA
jgi:hypothetical protein